MEIKITASMANKRVDKNGKNSTLKGRDHLFHQSEISIDWPRSEKKKQVYAHIRPRGPRRVSTSILSPLDPIPPVLLRSKSSSEGDVSKVEDDHVLPWSYAEKAPCVPRSKRGDGNMKELSEMTRESEISLDVSGRKYETIGGVEVEMFVPANKNNDKVLDNLSVKGQVSKNGDKGEGNSGDSTNVCTAALQSSFTSAEGEVKFFEDDIKPRKTEQVMFRQNALHYDSKDSSDQDVANAPDTDMDASSQNSLHLPTSRCSSASGWVRGDLSRQDSMQSSILATAGSPPLTSEEHDLIDEVTASLTDLEDTAKLNQPILDMESVQQDPPHMNCSPNTTPKHASIRPDFENHDLLLFPVTSTAMSTDVDFDVSGGVAPMTSTPIPAGSPSDGSAHSDTVYDNAKVPTTTDVVSVRRKSAEQAAIRPERVCSVYDTILFTGNESEDGQSTNQDTEKNNSAQNENPAPILPVSMEYAFGRSVKVGQDSSASAAHSSQRNATTSDFKEVDSILTPSLDTTGPQSDPPVTSKPVITTQPAPTSSQTIPLTSESKMSSQDIPLTSDSHMSSQTIPLTSESQDVSQSPQPSSRVSSTSPHPSPILCQPKRGKASAGSSRSVSFSLNEPENKTEPKSSTQQSSSLGSCTVSASCVSSSSTASASVTEGQKRLGKVLEELKKVEVRPSGYSLKDLATTGLSVIGGGVKDVVKIFSTPFFCCSSRQQDGSSANWQTILHYTTLHDWTLRRKVIPDRCLKAYAQSLGAEEILKCVRPEEPRVIRHQFRLYHFRRPHTCYVCKQQVYNQGSACQVCRYICHRRCEMQVMTSCVPQVSNDLSNEALNKPQLDRSVGQSSQGSRSVMSSFKDMLNRSQDGTEELLMDLTYITERIISMTFPSEGHDTTYAFNLKDVVRMLKTKHGDNYLVLNLSEKRQDLVKANPQVKDYGWPDHLAPPLERLCSVCKAIDAWLNADPRNVAVLHCKGGRARIAIIIASYMHYSNICASADQALDRFAMKRFYDDKLGGLPLPSQRRYVHYFAGLLSGAIKINSNPLYLHHILIHGVPNFDNRGGCRPFIKVYQSMQPIFTSGVYNVTDNMQKVCISISPGIPLRGDILIKCYHKNTKTGQREIIWQCQFHTCAIQDGNVVFSKQELDDGINDPRFPDSGKVEFVFGPTSDVPVSVSGFKSDVTVPVDDNEDSLTRSDSYENFHKALAAQGLEKNKVTVVNGLSTQPGNRGQRFQPGHAQGPWDGSLYATVNKQRREELEATGLTLNGASLQANGSLASSVDSGYVGPRDTSYGSQQHHHSELMSSSYTSHVNSSRTNYSSSTLTHTGGATGLGDQVNYNSVPRQKTSVPPLEERSQLDELLSDLLSDQVIVTSPTSPRSPSGTQSPLGLSSSQQNTMKGAKTVTTTTRTYHTYTSTDSGGGRHNPDKVLIQRAEVTYKVPGQGEERQLYTIAGEPPELEKPRVPEGAFSYTSTSPTQIDQSRSFQSLERDMNRTERITGLQKSPPSHTQTLPYRTDYENRYTASESQRYNTLDSDQAMWLQEQQQKLQRKRDGRDSSGRTEQEKQLVNELRFAQNRYYSHQTHSESDEKNMTDAYRQPPMHNGPLSSSSVPVNYAPPPRGFGGESGHFSTYSQYSESHYGSGGDRSVTKPPPSPTSQRAAGPQAVQPPARSSSKDYMRSRSHSSSSSNLWQTSPPANRPLARQYSDTLLDREPEPIQAQRAPSSRTTPPLSPHGTRSPMGPTATTTYTTYRTIHKEVHDEPMAKPQPQPQLQAAVAAPPVQSQAPLPQPQPPQQQTQHNYITEVFVHRVGGDKKTHDKPDSTEDTRLDELTRSLQAATDSIMEERMSNTHQQQQQQSFQKSSWQEHYQSVSSIHSQELERYGHPAPRMSSASDSSRSRSASPDWDNPGYSQVQKTQEGPPPKPVNVIEEDRITLRPIGPGMQTLEPEMAHSTSTLNRATTPTFPTSPATPPFPVSPRTMHRSAVRSPYPVFYSRPPTPEIPGAIIQRHESSDTLTGSLAPVFESTETLTEATAPFYRSSELLYAAGPARRRASSGAASRSGGSGMVTPAGTISSSQSYSQQHQYHQQYQHNQQHTDGTLHIDTSQRMLSPNQARSPSSAGSPHSPGNLNTLRQELSAAHAMSGSVVHPQSLTGQSSPSVYFGLSRRGSMSSLAESDMVLTTPKFVKDTSKYWYKPNITREDAIALLRDKAPGSFVIRDSNSFPGAYGLALKVAQIPPNVQAKPTNDPQAELVRHFLIEPTPKGVRLRGCSNEPVFGSLAALVYQHSITPLALPCKLTLPDLGMDVVDVPVVSHEVSSPAELNLAADLLAKGAACNVIFINTVDTESLTGPQAIAKAIKTTIESQPVPKTTVVHFKVSNQGITLTDNNRKLFFRRHYPVSAVTYCGMDPQDRRWKRDVDNPNLQVDAKIFGFVARKHGGGTDNSCHLFAELDPEQPASAIVNFITKVMIGQSKVKS